MSDLGSSVHGISQARILEWVAISFSRGSLWLRDWTHISCIGRQILYCWATREAFSSTAEAYIGAGTMVNSLSSSAQNWVQVHQQASLVAQTAKLLPIMQETWVRSLGREDPLEKEMATHSSILAWKIPWTNEHGRLQSVRLQRAGHEWTTSLSLHTNNWASQVALVIKNPPASAGGHKRRGFDP